MLLSKQVSTNAHPFLIHWLILSLGLLVLGGAIGYSITHEHNRIDAMEQDRLVTQAKVVDVNLGRQLVALNRALVNIRKDLPYWKAQKNGETMANLRLQAISDAIPGIRTLHITDAGGTVFASNRNELIGLNFRDREYFRVAHKGLNQDMLYISPPFKTVLGVYAVNAVKVVLDAHGTFSGIVSSTLDPEYCTVLLNSVLYTQGMRASLIHGDGKVFIEMPAEKNLAGLDLNKPGSRYTLHKESGREANVFTTGRAFTTGDYRMSAWRTIRLASLIMDKPLMISVNRDMQGIFASWRREAITQGGLFGVLALFAVFGLYFYQRRQQKYESLAAAYTVELRGSEERFRRLANATWEGIIIQRDGIILDANESALKMFGYPAEGIINTKILELFAPESIDAALQKLAESIATPQIPQMYLEAMGLRKDKTVFPIEMLGNPIRYNNLDARVIAIRDLTERKRAEAEIRKSEQHFRIIFERSTIGKSLTAPDGKLLRINKAFADMLGYTIEEIQEFNFAQITHQDDVAESRECINSLLAGEQTTYRFEKRYIHKNGNIVWADVSTTLLRDEQGTPLHLITSIVDITKRKQAEKQLQDTLQSLRNAVGTTIQVMVSAVETRDPYTSGHQLRSADLALAIAMEMGLPQDKIEGIRMAGSIHDIGKLSIPAEILSKPTKLSEIEFSLIKEHARKGFEMLKGVESPWPLAEIVLQHHERMDGSGYPRNLKGDDILIEARILNVADVVEAMASHRPYRAGLGIDAALNEIEKNRGIFYDKTVADACLRLFREKGFKLEGIL